MTGKKISVWIGAFSEYWRPHLPHPGDAWAVSTVLEVGDDGAVKARRDANTAMVAWVEADHWKELE